MKVTVEELRSMSVEALLEARRQIDGVLSERREELERQLEQITGQRPFAKQQSGEVVNPPQKKRPGNKKVVWRYRSKKDPALLWSGRGVLPRWMRDEMKGTKFTREDFRISTQ